MEKPSDEDCTHASDTLSDFADWLEENEPYAVNSIAVLRQAAIEILP